jgi:two-component system, chemotaxis family, chemotaxis protein CheY
LTGATRRATLIVMCPTQDGREGMAEPRATSVLVVDDDAYVRKVCRMALEGEGYEVREAATGKEGLRLLRERPVDLVVCDVYMPEMDGIEAIPALVAERPGCKILAVSGAALPLPDLLSTAEMLGAVRTLSKPFTPAELLDAVRAILAADQ